MSPVHKLSAMGSITSNKIDYPSMLAGYGDFGALQRIGYSALSGNGTFAFNNIPQNFQDLRLVISARSTVSATQDQIAGLFNSDGNTRYSFTLLSGNGSSAVSQRGTNQTFWRIGTIPGATSTSGIFGAMTVDILNYANTSTFKTSICRSAADLNGSGESRLDVVLYQFTGAITSISFNPLAASGFTAGSTAALYGVKASAA